VRFGLRGFSPQIDELVERRIYGPHTVDAVLEDAARQVDPLDCEWLRAPPERTEYALDSLRDRRPILAAIVDREAPDHGLDKLARFTARLAEVFPSPEHSNAAGCYRTPDDFIWGGTEEQIIAKGSDWCTEVARLLVALVQVAGSPARLVYTYSDRDGHVIAEAHDGARWWLVDPLAPKVYASDLHGLATGTDAEREALTSGREGYYVHPRYFEHVAVSEYRLVEADRYTYDESRCNDFYRRLLAPVWNK
jgi:hypothetical protein